MNAPRITFAFLQERFVIGLERRMTHLVEGIDLVLSSAEARALNELTRGFHSLAGIGGTYGFAEIGDLASIGEAACQSIQLPVSVEDARLLGEVMHSLRLAAGAVIERRRTGVAA